MENTFEKIYAIVSDIPSGKVATYGQVAWFAGNPRWARVVGYAMAGCSKRGVPCHRVVKKGGVLSVEGQRELLLREGVAFLPDGRVDMEKSGWI